MQAAALATLATGVDRERCSFQTLIKSKDCLPEAAAVSSDGNAEIELAAGPTHGFVVERQNSDE